jgi:uncharacterized membrane protein YhaH (DUF805 family)
MEWYLAVWKKYADFTGRARRKELWMFVLFNFIIGFIGGSLANAVPFIGILVGLYNLAALVPSFAVGARRLHDIGKSGWLQLIILVPIIGAIVLIVWYCQPGQSGANAYGNDPKAGAAQS